MQHSPIVRGRQARGKLACDLQPLLAGEVADPLYQRGEILSVNVFHGKKVLTVELRDVVNPANIRMRQLPCNPNLGEEALSPHGI